jgi:hypothetical protein
VVGPTGRRIIDHAPAADIQGRSEIGPYQDRRRSTVLVDCPYVVDVILDTLERIEHPPP